MVSHSSAVKSFLSVAQPSSSSCVEALAQSTASTRVSMSAELTGLAVSVVLMSVLPCEYERGSPALFYGLPTQCASCVPSLPSDSCSGRPRAEPAEMSLRAHFKSCRGCLHGGPRDGPPYPPHARGAPAKPWHPSILRLAFSGGRSERACDQRHAAEEEHRTDDTHDLRRRHAPLHPIPGPDARPRDRKKHPDREPQVAAGEESREGECSDAQPHVEGDHLRDRRALHRRVGNAPGDVDDVGRTADTEQCAEHAAE